MEKDTIETSTEIEELQKKNKTLQQQLSEAKQTLDLIKKGRIDALVEADKKDLKIYTEATADKTYRILIEKMHEGAVTLNKEGTILYCNSCFADMINVPLEKLIGTKLKDIINDSSKTQFEDLIKQGWEKDTRDELYIYSLDGKPVPLVVSLKKLELEDQELLSIIFTDITKQKKSEEELKLKNKVLEEAEKLAEIGSWVVDLTTNEVTASNELYEIYELDSVKEPKKFTPFELIHQNDLEVSRVIFETAIKESGTFDTYTVITIPPDNKEKKLHIKGKVVTVDGKAVKLIGITQDVTALIKAGQNKAPLVNAQPNKKIPYK